MYISVLCIICKFTFDLTRPFEMYSQVVQADPSESCWFDSQNQGKLSHIHQHALITSYM